MKGSSGKCKMSKSAKKKTGLVFERRQIFDSVENLTTPDKYKGHGENGKAGHTACEGDESDEEFCFEKRVKAFQTKNGSDSTSGEDKSTFKDRVAAFEQFSGTRGSRKRASGSSLGHNLSRWKEFLQGQQTPSRGTSGRASGPRGGAKAKCSHNANAAHNNSVLSKWQSLPLLDVDQVEDSDVTEDTDNLLDDLPVTDDNLMAGMSDKPPEAPSSGKKIKPHWTTVFSHRISMIRQKLESRCAAERQASHKGMPRKPHKTASAKSSSTHVNSVDHRVQYQSLSQSCIELTADDVDKGEGTEGDSQCKESSFDQDSQASSLDLSLAQPDGGEDAHDKCSTPPSEDQDDSCFIRRGGKPLTPVPWRKTKLLTNSLEGAAFRSINEENNPDMFSSKTSKVTMMKCGQVVKLIYQCNLIK